MPASSDAARRAASTAPVSAQDPLARRRSAVILLARALSPLQERRHVRPDFLIVGAARAGTTSVLNHLRSHPGVLHCPRRELHFFDVEGRWSQGLGSYLRQFPHREARAAAISAGRGPAISGENSPYYLAHPLVAERVHATLPDVRLIALLRDPTDRAISHWNWRYNQKQEPRSFEALVEEELAALADVPPGGSAGLLVGSGSTVAGRSDGVAARSAAYATAPDSEWARRNQAYLARGIYLEQLLRWNAVFPRERLLVVISERYYRDPDAQLRRIFDHVGLPWAETEDTKPNARRRRLDVDPALVARVRAFFRPHNAALADHLGEDPGWD
ncbi:MAG: sulfotransferase domain-containing protein [Thermoleophilia bacterium]|nr:sulfotransferase domain-containing protein [Thermoleophilia bacterium]